ncbi:DUF441 domain-containing protein [Longirhabdus pacifica]|uniref:DUF441 domain-containing protein n=1 Tax=Longirhabdus pacifica TaxID=2305227 RepID=UPI00197F4438|nr:DUF441 domain-containing protein [Longirhabdus pacifica]
MDSSLWILLAIALLGYLSKNLAVTIALLLLAIIKLTPLDRYFPLLEKHGVTIGIIILTMGVMTPLARGKISFDLILKSFTQWQSLLAIVIGIFVSYLGARGVGLMSGNPLIVTGLLVGTLIGVGLFKGVPVGPLIAAGMLALILGK